MNRSLMKCALGLGIGCGLVSAVIGVAWAKPMGAAAAEPAAALNAVTLLNDSWIPESSASFQGIFVAQEMAAARLVPPGPDPVQVTAVQFLFGGAAGSITVTLHIWDDAAQTLNPGSELFAGDYVLAAADDALQVIDLISEDLVISDAIRVGVEFQADGLPATATDDDGLTNSGHNFVYSGGWMTAQSAGLPGDWIIRAVVAEAGFTVLLPLIMR